LTDSFLTLVWHGLAMSKVSRLSRQEFLSMLDHLHDGSDLHDLEAFEFVRAVFANAESDDPVL